MTKEKKVLRARPAEPDRPSDQTATDTEAFSFAATWSEMQDVHERGLRAFAYWVHRHWKMVASREEWERTNQDPYPGDDHIQAYNAGVESVLSAVDFYIEESNR